MADEQSISTPIAAVACVSMAVLYVVILYAPTVLLRLPHPSSVKDYMLRRFVCAIISSLLSLYLSSLIIPVSLFLFSLLLDFRFEVKKKIYLHFFSRWMKPDEKHGALGFPQSLWNQIGSYCEYLISLNEWDMYCKSHTLDCVMFVLN